MPQPHSPAERRGVRALERHTRSWYLLTLNFLIRSKMDTMLGKAENARCRTDGCYCHCRQNWGTKLCTLSPTRGGRSPHWIKTSEKGLGGYHVLLPSLVGPLFYPFCSALGTWSTGWAERGIPFQSRFTACGRALIPEGCRNLKEPTIAGTSLSPAGFASKHSGYTGRSGLCGAGTL
jgi:hypothetical protein